MDVEDDIASGAACTTYQRMLLDSLAPLRRKALATYLASGKYDRGHVQKALSIRENRYTCLGWKSYMYCYVHMLCEQQDIEVFVDTVARMVSGLCSRSPLSLFFQLFLGHSLMSVQGQRPGSYQWKYFSRGIWIDADHTQVCNMIETRIEMHDILSRLGMDTRRSRGAIADVVKVMGHSNSLVSCLYYPHYREDRDPKEETFAMPTCTYDMVYGVVRQGLPGDLSTMRGGVDPDSDAWHEHRHKMLAVFEKWLGRPDVASNFMNILAAALGEFKDKFTVINSGTGSDGKTTASHIIKEVFGGYCAMTPATGPNTDTRGSNEATPLATMLVGKRVSVTADCKDVVAVISSPGFKSISGGDPVYLRQMYREADTRAPTLKLLPIINTNQVDMVLPHVSSLVRIRVFRWTSKTVTDEDKALIPSHRIKSSTRGKFNYERLFMKRYATCLMTELIQRHKELLTTNMRTSICETVVRWTQMAVAPKSILSFLKQCTQQGLATDDDGSTPLVAAEDLQDESAEPSIEELFVVYMGWRRRRVRLSSTDPNTLEMFRLHLEFYYPVSTRQSDRSGEGEEYIEGLYFNSEAELLSMPTYMGRGGGGTLLPSIIGGGARRVMDTFSNRVEEID